MLFKDRYEAGFKLSQKLVRYRHESPLVVGISRNGVMVASEVAYALGAPLEVLLIEKLNSDLLPNLAIAAIGTDGTTVLNDDLIRLLGVTQKELLQILEKGINTLEKRQKIYPEEVVESSLDERTVILVDDGLNTGIRARAAIQMLRQNNAGKIILATPVSSPEAALSLYQEADQFVSLKTPADFWQIKSYYCHFPEITDKKAVQLIKNASKYVSLVS